MRRDTERTDGPVETAQAFIERKQREFAIRKPTKHKDIGRQGAHYWEREAWTFMVQSNLAQKVFLMERLRLLKSEGQRARADGAKPGDREYRIGYWTVGKIGRAKNRWTWGQFSPMIPEGDLDKLLDLARQEGTLQ